MLISFFLPSLRAQFVIDFCQLTNSTSSDHFCFALGPLSGAEIKVFECHCTLAWLIIFSAAAAALQRLLAAADTAKSSS